MIHIRNEKVGKTHTDQRTRRGVIHARWKMLLNNESGRARSERVLVAAQVSCGSRFAYRSGDFARSSRAAADNPNTKYVTFAVCHRDDAVGRNLRRTNDGLINNCGDIGCSQLRECGRCNQAQHGNPQKPANLHCFRITKQGRIDQPKSQKPSKIDIRATVAVWPPCHAEAFVKAGAKRDDV